MSIKIGITMGDPAGIGPEIILKAFASGLIPRSVEAVVFGDRAWLQKTARSLKARGIKVPDIVAIPSSLFLSRQIIHVRHVLPVFDLKNIKLSHVRVGHVSAAAGRASGEYIQAAVEAAQAGWIDAVVTAPINKVSFKLGGWGRRYAGHTEMLAGLTQAPRVALMLAIGNLRAVHVTSHLAL